MRLYYIHVLNVTCTCISICYFHVHVVKATKIIFTESYSTLLDSVAVMYTCNAKKKKTGRFELPPVLQANILAN